VVAFSTVVFAMACGGGSTSDNGTKFDRGPEAGDVPITEDIVVHEVLDEGQPDDSAVDPDDASVQPDDAKLPDEGPDTKDVPIEIPENPTEGLTEDVTEEGDGPQMCPCDETFDDYPVCGQDGKDYPNDICAACAQCKDATDCTGCEGEKACDMLDPEGPDGYIKQKAACDECICDDEDECEDWGLGFPCGPFCDMGPDEIPDTSDDVTYETPCDMKIAYDCNDSYDENLNYLGACKDATCVPCEDLPKNPVCGDDGVSYNNFCELQNCPDIVGASLDYLGACLNADFCPDCQGDNKSAVCGKDGVTYANECAAVDCMGQEVDYEGPCCVECNGVPVDEVCGMDFLTYPNDCVLLCMGIGKKYDGPCTCDCDIVEDLVCGDDGLTYVNECWMTCEGAGKLYDGECIGDCPQCGKDFTPVCGTDGKTYPNQCFAECFEAGPGSAGVCNGCEAICGTADNPKPGFGGEVCDDNGITYPTSCFPDKCHFGDAIGYTTGACI